MWCSTNYTPKFKLEPSWEELKGEQAYGARHLHTFEKGYLTPPFIGD